MISGDRRNIHPGVSCFIPLQAFALRQAFSSVFGMPYLVSLLIGAVVVISYTFAGGFFAVCWTDFFQAPVDVLRHRGTSIAIGSLGGPADFLRRSIRLTRISCKPVRGWRDQYALHGHRHHFVDRVGLGYFGQPHILIRFMGIESPKAIEKSRRIATVWVLISLTAAVLIGPAACSPGDGLSSPRAMRRTIYIEHGHPHLPRVHRGHLLSAILAAIMSTADSQLLVTASAITEDFYHNKIRPNASAKELM